MRSLVTPRARLVLAALVAVAPSLGAAVSPGGVPVAWAGPPGDPDPDPVHDPVANCDPSHQQSGNFAFAGVATAPSGHTPPTWLTIVCRYRNTLSQYVSINSMPGPVVVTFGAGPRLPGATTICASATAEYADGHVGTAPETCHPQGSLLPPPPSGAPAGP